MRFALALLLTLLCVPCLLASAQAGATPPPAQDQVQDQLHGQLQAIASEHKGSVAFYAENLETHQTVALDADAVVQTASVIKLGILYEALEQIRAGKVHFEDRIDITGPDQVPGSGILHLLDVPMTVTFKDVLTLMIIVSDNEAANLAIDHLGLQNIDHRLAALGLANTYLYKKVFTKLAPGQVMPEDFKRYGLGKTTPHEMARLMTKLVRCELAAPGTSPLQGDAALCRVADDILHVQFYRGAIPRYLDGLPGATGTSIANKTGALDAVRNDVAAISTPNGMIVMAAFTYGNRDHSWVVDQPGELTIAKLARAVVSAWSPTGLAPWPADGAQIPVR
jgi:beta-lactamase class A